MDTSTMLTDLRAQRDRINQAITALEALNGSAVVQTKTTAKPNVPALSPKPASKKRIVSPEARKRMAEAQQKRWAAKKKTEKKAAKAAKDSVPA